MDYNFDTVVKLENGEFKELSVGHSYLSDEERARLLNEEIVEYELSYEWNEQPVSKEAYYESLNSIYDTEKAEEISNPKLTFSDVLDRLK